MTGSPESNVSLPDGHRYGEQRQGNKEEIRRLAIDPHSPPEYRVLGVLVNNDDFIAAFDVQPGDGMWKDPQERVNIW